MFAFHWFNQCWSTIKMNFDQVAFFFSWARLFISHLWTSFCTVHKMFLSMSPIVALTLRISGEWAAARINSTVLHRWLLMPLLMMGNMEIVWTAIHVERGEKPSWRSNVIVRLIVEQRKVIVSHEKVSSTVEWLSTHCCSLNIVMNEQVVAEWQLRLKSWANTESTIDECFDFACRQLKFSVDYVHSSTCFPLARILKVLFDFSSFVEMSTETRRQLSIVRTRTMPSVRQKHNEVFSSYSLMFERCETNSDKTVFAWLCDVDNTAHTLRWQTKRTKHRKIV
jgi:hypothetical protein